MGKEKKAKEKILPVIKELLSVIRYPIPILIFWVVFIVLAQLASIYFLDIIGKITQTLSDGKGFEILDYIPLILMAMVVQLLSNFFCRRIQGGLQATAQYKMANHTFRSMVLAKQAWIEDQKSGDLMNRIGESLSETLDFIANRLPQLIHIFLSIILMAAYLFTNNWKLAALYFVLYPVLIFLQNAISKPMRTTVDDRLVAGGKCNNLSLDTMRNISTVKAYQLEDYMAEEYGKRSVVLKKLFYRFTFIKSLVCFLGEAVANLPTVAVCVGAYIMVINGSLEIGAFLAFLLVMMNLNSPLHNFGRLMADIRGSFAGALRVVYIWRAPAEVRSQPETTPVKEPNAVVFENVAFSYNADDAVLKGITFRIKEGERLALVGESGCGKSTVIRLLGGLYPAYTGTIRVLGHDLKDWNPAYLRQNMSLVTQSSELFPVSLGENIRWANESASQQDVEAAAKSAGIHEFIQSLPERYETLAGERGTQLSGGQKQRVAIARALLRNAPLLILDEATSALDSQTEREVQMEFDKLMRGKTAIIIAHRLTSLRNVDRIIVMDHGKIAEEGSHTELMAKKGVFYALYQKQAADSESEGMNNV